MPTDELPELTISIQHSTRITYPYPCVYPVKKTKRNKTATNAEEGFRRSTRQEHVNLQFSIVEGIAYQIRNKRETRVKNIVTTKNNQEKI